MPDSTPVPGGPDRGETPQSLLTRLGGFRLQELPPLQKALRQLLIGVGVVLVVFMVYVAWAWSVEMPPRPALSASREIQDTYREQREAAKEDAESRFSLLGSAFLVPTFTALLGYFVGVKADGQGRDAGE